MTNGPDDQPGQEPPPPPPPPPSGGRGLFSRPDPSQPNDLEPRTPPPAPRQGPRAQQPAQPAQTPPQQGTDDNPFLLPNERDRMPVYGAAPPMPVIPLALMVLAIVVGGALFYMSQEDKKDSGGGITPQQASAGLVLHFDGLDMTEDAFRREISKGIANGRIPCNVLAPQPADNIAAGLKLGALRMEVPSTSGVASKKDQKADDASLLLAATIVKDTCPKADVPAPGVVPGAPTQPGQQVPGAPGAQTPAPPGQPVPGSQPPGQPVPGSASPAAGTPRPVTSPAAPGPGGGAPPVATPRP